MSVIVHSGNEPFLTDNYQGASSAAGTWHIVSAIDIEPGAPAKIKVDNQWGKEADHLTNNRLTPNELFGAMKKPGDIERMVEIIAALSPEKRTEALGIEYQSGFYDNSYLDKQFAKNIVQIKSAYQTGQSAP